jgi:hypothetical protein
MEFVTFMQGMSGMQGREVSVKIAARKGRPHKPKGTGARTQLGYRPDDEVLAMIRQAAETAGRTMSAEIDATLRRAYQMNRQDRAELEDLFGGADNFAFGFLMARVRSAIESECLHFALPGTAAEAQVKQAHDFVVTTASGKTFAVETKPAGTGQTEPTTRTEIPPVFISFSSTSLEPWHRVLAAIAQNLSSPGTEIWWPLADHPKQRRRAEEAEPPLRPTLEQLRAICPLRTKPKGTMASS